MKKTRSLGYTITSMVIATVIFGILALMAAYGVNRAMSNGRMESAQQQLTTVFANAAYEMYTHTGNSSRWSTAALKRYGAPMTTVFDTGWTASVGSIRLANGATAKGVFVDYDVPTNRGSISADDVRIMAKGLLDQGGTASGQIIQSATVPSCSGSYCILRVGYALGI
jgi:type II secretory pathway pseudopilin PulG